ncbi:MAG: Hsp20/alpha crystallin family protein [Patescibacteria group bacterium]|nr:Hsp20/alpha crystallin family protein [Patescibacteria group bacterium]
MKKLFKKLSGFDKKSNPAEPKEAELDNINEEDLDYMEQAVAEDRELEEPLDGEEKTDEENLEEKNSDEDEKWLSEDYEEGQLSIDVYQTPHKIIVKSTIAGVKPEDIDISVNNDMLTIRGKREMEEKINEENYLFRECYWGSFSRSIILPVEIETDKIEAVLENGVLTIILPKAKNAQEISIKVKEK